MVIKKKVVKQQAKRILAFVFAFILTVGTMSTLQAGMFVKKTKAAQITHTMDLSNLISTYSTAQSANWQAVTNDGYFTVMGYGAVDTSKGTNKGTVIENRNKSIDGKVFPYDINTQGTASEKQASASSKHQYPGCPRRFKFEGEPRF